MFLIVGESERSIIFLRKKNKNLFSDQLVQKRPWRWHGSIHITRGFLHILHNHPGCFCLTFSYFFCGFSNFIRGRVKEGLIFANINFSGQLVQKWPPHLANGSDLLWEDIGPDISCKNTTDWYWRFEINFPSKVFFLRLHLKHLKWIFPQKSFSENTFETFEMNFPTKVFSEITFILTGVCPVIQLRPLGLDTLRVKSFPEKSPVNCQKKFSRILKISFMFSIISEDFPLKF